MHILFVVPYAPNVIRVRPYNLIRSLARRGHHVTLATLWSSEGERADLNRLAAEGVRVLAHRLPAWRSLWNCLRALPTRVPLQAVYCWQPALAKAVQKVISQKVEKGEGQQEQTAIRWIGSRPSRSLVNFSTFCPFDLIHVEHLRGAHYGLLVKSAIRNPQSEIPVVWDSVDCISYLFEQAMRDSRSLKGRLMTRLELARTRRYEAWLLTQFDRVLVTSEVDKAALLELTPSAGGQGEKEERKKGEKRVGGVDARIRPPNGPYAVRNSQCPISVLPNGVDLDYFTPIDEPREPATLVFSGKMSYHANVTAVLHLVHDIMPLVWRERPDVQLWIVGKDPPREIRALADRKSQMADRKSQIADCRWQIANRRLVLSRAEGSQSAICNLQSAIHVTGTVPDIRPYMRRATLAVAPVPYGAGVQNKVLEAMACGTPVVVSPQAIAALAVQSGRDLAVADGPEAFARAVLELLDDPARRAQLGRAGRAYVEQHHSWDAITARLESIYRETMEALPMSF